MKWSSHYFERFVEYKIPEGPGFSELHINTYLKRLTQGMRRDFVIYTG